jgi:hypothetical protein
MSPYSYQHERMAAAISYLMMPDLAFEKRLTAAMLEFWHAFHDREPSDLAFDHFDTIKRIMGDSASEPLEERAKSLTPPQRNQIINAFWELDRAVSRDYYTYEAER